MKIGVDLVLKSRFENKSEHFINRLLTENEMREYQKANDKITYLGVHFAFKEAIYKATQDLQYLKYELLHDDRGKPFCNFHDNIEISISHDGDYIIVVVFVNDTFNI